MKSARREFSVFAPLVFLALLLVSNTARGDDPAIAGFVEGTGTQFLVTDSQYKNPTIQSSEVITMSVQSTPRLISMCIKPTGSGVLSTQLTLRGLDPLCTYYKYEDTYQGHVLLSTDQFGDCSYEQDLSQEHQVFVQEQPSTRFIPSDTNIGVWDAVSGIYTLTTNVFETIQVDVDGLTLDGAGHMIDGGGVGSNGVYLFNRSGVTIRNLTITGFSSGVYLYNASNNTITNNSFMLNNGYAINIAGPSTSSFNLISNNTITNNASGIWIAESDGNVVTNNFLSNLNSSYPGPLGYGMSGYAIDNHIFSGNTIEHFEALGLYFRGNRECDVYNNNFLHNNPNPGMYGFPSSQASWEDYISPSQVDFSLSLPVGGNHWSDWTSPDTGGDGFVDFPYVIYAARVGLPNLDNHPWVDPNGWANQAPVAEAGQNEAAHPGVTVALDGGGSTDSDGHYPLTYQWTFVALPAGSATILTNANTLNPTFVPDLLGDYVIELVVTDSLGLQSVPDYVTISTLNAAPLAEAGEDQAIVQIGSLVLLDGTESWDDDGDDLSYSWQFTTVPSGSSAILLFADTATPSFVADLHGDYVITLVVTDILGYSSDPDSVTISFANVPPVADSGMYDPVQVFNTVYLDGSGSSDANLDSLAYSWTFVTRPSGSTATFSDPTSLQPTFVPDVSGNYVVSLVVNDGFANSDPSNATIFAFLDGSVVISKLSEFLDALRGLQEADWKNRNMPKAMGNKINSVVDLIEAGSYEEAQDKLEKDILKKTDGCATDGSPDKNDWIVTCSGQSSAYQLIGEAIALLDLLIVP